MNPEERSRALLREADEVLELIHLKQHCAAIGDITFTGSYFMDLMMYPDVDLYLPQTSPETLLSLAVELSKYDCVQRMNYIRGGPGELKEGLYLKPVVGHGNWGRPWKIDIWSVSTSLMEKKQSELTDLKNRMTPAQRARILNLKHQLLNAEGRTPMYSGFFIYKAVVDHGIEVLEEVIQFLRENKIKI